MPAAASALATVDLDGEGHAELLVGQPGRIFEVSTAGALRLLLEGDSVDLGALPEPALGRRSRISRELAMTDVGGLWLDALDDLNGDEFEDLVELQRLGRKADKLVFEAFEPAWRLDIGVIYDDLAVFELDRTRGPAIVLVERSDRGRGQSGVILPTR